MQRLQPELIRQLFMLLLILFLGILIFIEMSPYLGGVLGAITLYVLFHKWMEMLVKKGWHPDLAAITLIIGSFIGILMPITGIVLLLGSKVEKAVKNTGKFVEIIKDQIQNIEYDYGYNLSSQIQTSEVTSWISTQLQNLAGGTFDVVIAIGIMYILLYYMLISRQAMQKTFQDYIPMRHENIQLIGKESWDMVRANAIGIPFVAICQGLIALIGYLILGVPNPMFWFVITTIGSMIPFVGALLGTVPLTILLLAQGHTWQGIGVGLYGLIIVGSMDNLVRLYVLRRIADVHPLITLIGVIIGVPLFGFIGLIFGPLLISLFMVIVKIYRSEYGGIHHKSARVKPTPETLEKPKTKVIKKKTPPKKKT